MWCPDPGGKRTEPEEPQRDRRMMRTYFPRNDRDFTQGAGTPEDEPGSLWGFCDILDRLEDPGGGPPRSLTFRGHDIAVKVIVVDDKKGRRGSALQHEIAAERDLGGHAVQHAGMKG